jgi:hypothetical protein
MSQSSLILIWEWMTSALSHHHHSLINLFD